MFNNKKVNNTLYLVILVISITMLITLWHKTSVLSKNLEHVEKNQSSIIQSQTKLEALTHLLSSSQIEKLKKMAFLSDSLAMKNLYLYYKDLKPSHEKNKIQAFTWGILSLIYSKNDKQNKNKMASLNAHYKKVLTKKDYKSAIQLILNNGKKINQNIDAAFNSFNSTIKKIEHTLPFLK